jgi:hypothetical protein
MIFSLVEQVTSCEEGRIFPLIDWEICYKKSSNTMYVYSTGSGDNHRNPPSEYKMSLPKFETETSVMQCKFCAACSHCSKHAGKLISSEFVVQIINVCYFYLGYFPGS